MVLSSKEFKRLTKLKSQEPIKYSDGYFQGWNEKKGGERQDLIFAVWDVFKKFYKDYLQDVEGRKRLINIPGDTNEYSKLNFLSSNSKTFAIMVNYLNEKIVDMAKHDELIQPIQRQFQFDKDKINWKSEMYFFIEVFNKYYEEIIAPNDNGVFDKLIHALENMGERGHDSEEKMMEFLKNTYPLAINWEIGADGKTDDIVKGIDISFSLKGEIYTIQQKSCSSVNLSDDGNVYFVNGVGGIKLYDTTYYGFRTNEDELFLFENDKSIKIGEHEGRKFYIIPYKLLEHQIKL